MGDNIEELNKVMYVPQIHYQPYHVPMDLQIEWAKNEQVKAFRRQIDRTFLFRNYFIKFLYLDQAYNLYIDGS